MNVVKAEMETGKKNALKQTKGVYWKQQQQQQQRKNNKKHLGLYKSNRRASWRRTNAKYEVIFCCCFCVFAQPLAEGKKIAENTLAQHKKKK